MVRSIFPALGLSLFLALGEAQGATLDIIREGRSQGVRPVPVESSFEFVIATEPLSDQIAYIQEGGGGAGAELSVTLSSDPLPAGARLLEAFLSMEPTDSGFGGGVGRVLTSVVPVVSEHAEFCDGPCEFSPSEIIEYGSLPSSVFLENAGFISDGVRYFRSTETTYFGLDLIAAGFGPQVRNGKPFDITADVGGSCCEAYFSIRPGFNSVTTYPGSVGGRVGLWTTLSYAYTIQPVPEPASGACVLAGLAAAGIAVRRSRRKG